MNKCLVTDIHEIANNGQSNLLSNTKVPFITARYPSHSLSWKSKQQVPVKLRYLYNKLQWNAGPSTLNAGL